MTNFFSGTKPTKYENINQTATVWWTTHCFNFSSGDYSAHSSIQCVAPHSQYMSTYFSTATRPLVVHGRAVAPRRVCTSDVSIRLTHSPLHCCLIADLRFRPLLGCAAHYWDIPDEVQRTVADLSLWLKSRSKLMHGWFMWGASARKHYNSFVWEPDDSTFDFQRCSNEKNK